LGAFLIPLAKHLTRREGTYYFRILVPRKLFSSIGRNKIICSLWMKEPAGTKRLSHFHSYNFPPYLAELEKKFLPLPLRHQSFLIGHGKNIIPAVAYLYPVAGVPENAGNGILV